MHLKSVVKQKSFLGFYDSSKRENQNVKDKILNYAYDLKIKILSNKANSHLLNEKLNDIAVRIQKRLNRGTLSHEKIESYKGEVLSLSSNIPENDLSLYFKSCIFLAKHSCTTSNKINYFNITNKTRHIEQLICPDYSRKPVSDLSENLSSELDLYLSDILGEQLNSSNHSTSSLIKKADYKRDVTFDKNNVKSKVKNSVASLDCDVLTKDNFATATTNLKNANYTVNPQRNVMHLFLHGSNDSQARYNGEGLSYKDPLIFSKLHEQIQNKEFDAERKCSSEVIDGPSKFLGERFTRNTFKGLGILLKHCVKTLNGNDTPELVITGHSRGAEEGIAINNLLVCLIKNNFNLENGIDAKFHKYLTLEDYTNIKKLANMGNRLNNINIKLFLFDPVLGTDYPLIARDGFKLAKQLHVLEDEKYKVLLFTASTETRTIMDLHIPLEVVSYNSSDCKSPVESAESYTISRVKLNADHGGTARYHNNDRTNPKNNGSNNALKLMRFLFGLKDLDDIKYHDEEIQNAKNGNNRIFLSFGTPTAKP